MTGAEQSTCPFFVVSYRVAGADCQGQYLARNKATANKVVRSYDKDYVNVWALSKKEYVEDFGQDDWQEMVEEHTNLQEGDSVSLWSGT